MTRIGYLIPAALALGFVLTGNFWYAKATQRSLVGITIQDKDRITTGAGDTLSSKYLVFTDNGVFENTDTIFYWKFDSSDLQGYMQVGQKCDLHVYGWRVPFLSWYPNIVGATCD